MSTINRKQVRQIIDSREKAILVDALPAPEFAKDHLPGAISMPLDRIDELAPRLLQNKAQKIITYCTGKACPASKKAAEALEKLGYTNVAEYTDGKADWKAAGLPLEGAETASRARTMSPGKTGGILRESGKIEGPISN